MFDTCHRWQKEGHHHGALLSLSLKFRVHCQSWNIVRAWLLTG